MSVRRAVFALTLGAGASLAPWVLSILQNNCRIAMSSPGARSNCADPFAAKPSRLAMSEKGIGMTYSIEVQGRTAVRPKQ